jgi:hypothetical protein
VKFAFRRVRLVRRQRGVVAIERGAIRAHILDVLAHVAEDMRMVLRRERTHAHEFLDADLNDLNAWVVMEMRNYFVGHLSERPRVSANGIERKSMREVSGGARDLVFAAAARCHCRNERKALWCRVP